MNTAVVYMAKELGMQILKKLPEYGAKFILGTAVGVGVHLTKEAIIDEITNLKKQKEQVTVEA